MDNGGGMTPENLHKMLGFGHSDKKEIDGHRYKHQIRFLCVLCSAVCKVIVLKLSKYRVLLQTNWEVWKWVRCIPQLVQTVAVMLICNECSPPTTAADFAEQTRMFGLYPQGSRCPSKTKVLAGLNLVACA